MESRSPYFSLLSLSASCLPHDAHPVSVSFYVGGQRATDGPRVTDRGSRGRGERSMCGRGQEGQEGRKKCNDSGEREGERGGGGERERERERESSLSFVGLQMRCRFRFRGDRNPQI